MGKYSKPGFLDSKLQKVEQSLRDFSLIELWHWVVYACDDEDFLVSDKIIAGMLHAYKDGGR
jgi:hypothetical protein